MEPGALQWVPNAEASPDRSRTFPLYKHLLKSFHLTGHRGIEANIECKMYVNVCNFHMRSDWKLGSFNT